MRGCAGAAFGARALPAMELAEVDPPAVAAKFDGSAIRRNVLYSSARAFSSSGAALLARFNGALGRRRLPPPAARRRLEAK